MASAPISGRSLRLGVLLGLSVFLACESLTGSDEGCCQSSPVEFSFGLRVYCQNDFDEEECADYDRQQVNGAEQWTFHEGQTCEDRDLVEGSNPWP